MGRQAFDSKWSRNADTSLVVVGTVIEHLDFGRFGNGSVDLPLPLDPRLPP